MSPTSISSMPNAKEVKNQRECMFLDLVHWFLCTNIFV
jgi:hypothetical protein